MISFTKQDSIINKAQENSMKNPLMIFFQRIKLKKQKIIQKEIFLFNF